MVDEARPFNLQGAEPVHDPHVACLIYMVSTGVNFRYEAPQTLEHADEGARYRIEGGKLRIEPLDHFASEQAARDAFEPFLRAWEMDAALRVGVGAIRFSYESSQVIDRNPQPPTPGRPVTLPLRGQLMVAAQGELGVHAVEVRKAYPAPPTSFWLTSGLEDAFSRWRRHREGRESLDAMAYFVLTVLEGIAHPTSPPAPRPVSKKRAAAASLFAVDEAVLSKLGELSSTRMRKYPPQPYGPGEEEWLRETVRVVILRLAEYRQGVAMATITLRDLPPV